MTCIVWDGNIMVVDKAKPRFGINQCSSCKYMAEVPSPDESSGRPYLGHDSKVYHVRDGWGAENPPWYYFTGVGWRSYIEAFWVWYAPLFGSGGYCLLGKEKLRGLMNERLDSSVGIWFVVLNRDGLLYFPPSESRTREWELCDVTPHYVGKNKCIIGVGADKFGYNILESGGDAIETFRAIMYRSYTTSDGEFDVYGENAYEVYAPPTELLGKP